MTALQVKGLIKNFGGLTVLNGVNLQAAAGERRAIIGPNGAGKTTLFKLIAGELPPTQGAVFLGGADITHLPVAARTRLGLSHTFQRNNLFLNLSVFENVRLAVQRVQGVAGQWFKPTGAFRAVNAATETLLSQLGLIETRNQLARHLAYGQQRALEIALALATQPTALLLDEPTAGMSPAETAEMVRFIESLPRSLTMLIVEHDMDVVFTLADRITVLHYGEVITDGAPAEVRANPVVQQIYLGDNSQ
jgi:branched-chain amino acid transport system ATP-binding protein